MGDPGWMADWLKTGAKQNHYPEFPDRFTFTIFAAILIEAHLEDGGSAVLLYVYASRGFHLHPLGAS